MVRFSLAKTEAKGKRKSFSNFAGLLGIKHLWQHLDLGELLTELGIQKRSGTISTKDLCLLSLFKPFIGARSEQQLAEKTQSGEDDCLISPKQIAQKKVNNFFNCQRFDFKEFFSQATGQVLQQPAFGIRSQDVFIIDDTPLAKSGRSMEHSGKLYDATRSTYYHGYELVGLAVARAHRKFFLDFAFKPPKRQKRKKKRGRRRKGYRPRPKPTKLTTALSLVKAAVAQGVRAKHVVFDSWYFALSFLKELSELELVFVAPSKKNRLFLYGGKKRKAEYFVKLAKSSHRPLRRFRVMLPGYGQVILAVVKRRLSTGKKRYEVLVSNDLTLSATKMKQIYLRRWNIETLFREAKQNFDLAGFHNRRFRAIVAHIAFSLLSMLLLQLFQSLHKVMKPMTLGKIKRHLIRVKVMVQANVNDWEVCFYENRLLFKIYKDLKICLRSV